MHHFTSSFVVGKVLLLVCSMFWQISAIGQPRLAWTTFPSIPDPEGMAGMFAGISGGQLFCMGGANFPEKRPWEGGQKVWYDRIHRFSPATGWVLMQERMPYRAGYGVSADFRNEIIIAGGSNDVKHLTAVRGFRWNGRELVCRSLPSLPLPLANMAGCLVDSLFILVGGTESQRGVPLTHCLALDLANPCAEWFRLPDCPGQGRTQPVSGSHEGAFYLFGGEATPVDSAGIPQRRVLRDAYRLILKRQGLAWEGDWQRIPDMPRAATAAANPVPVFSDGRFFFWGGVDESAAAQRDPARHPGFVRQSMWYHSKEARWEISAGPEGFPSRVTLPTVRWQQRWIYVSGEVRPGVRTPGIMGVSEVSH